VRNIALSAFIALLPCMLAGAADDASVLVTTEVPQRGELPDIVVGHGTAGPAIDHAMTLSLPAEGRVMRLFTTAGEGVRAGQPLLQFQLSAAASSALAQATTALSLARTEQARVERLLAQQLATREQKAQADKAAADAKTTLDALRRETGARELETLAAPFDGIVTAIVVAQGDRVAAGAPLMTLARNGGMLVTAGLEPRDVRRLSPGQPVALTSLADDASRPRGRVSKIDKSLNPKTRLVDVDVAIDDDVLNGEAFRVDIEIGRIGGWLLPRNAVLDDDDGPAVFQIKAGKAIRVEVKRVATHEGTTAVDGSIDPTLRIVVEGNYQLSDGALVRERDSVKPADAAEAAKTKKGSP
jgi:RND family efflux transporter MFP subunit